MYDDFDNFFYDDEDDYRLFEQYEQDRFDEANMELLSVDDEIDEDLLDSMIREFEDRE